MLHSSRAQALSFGEAGEEYDRARPSYPESLIQDLVEHRPQRVLDVGTGTGLVSRQLRAHVTEILGIEPDVRMAAVARRHGLTVENATFETWEPRSRRFDLVLSGQAWHWVEPVAGARKAVSVLSPGGRLAVFWNFARPSPRFLAAVLPAYHRHAPALATRSLLLGNADDRVAQAAARFRESASLRAVTVKNYWSSVIYTPRQWVDHIQTWSDHKMLPDRDRANLVRHIEDALGELGEEFVMGYENTLVSAWKRSGAGHREATS